MSETAVKIPSVISNKQSEAKSAARKAVREAKSAARERVQELLSMPGFDEMFVQIAVSLLPDPNLNPGEKWVYITIRFIIWLYDGRCDESLEVIAGLSGVSPRTAGSAVRVLCSQGRLIVGKNPNRKYPDTLTLPQVTAKLSVSHRHPGRCARCGADRSLDVMSVCTPCRKREKLKHEMKDFLTANPGADYAYSRTVVVAEKDRGRRRAFEEAKAELESEASKA